MKSWEELGCIGGTLVVLVIVALVTASEYLFTEIICGIWNHMVVPAFHVNYMITAWQAFVVLLVLQFLGMFFSHASSTKE